MSGKRKKRRAQIFSIYMQRKLAFLFVMVLLAFAMLATRIWLINRDKGAAYKKQVLSQRHYDSRTLPYKRGMITDCKGTILADSELVYNVIVDSYHILQNTSDAETLLAKGVQYEYLEPSLNAAESLGANRAELAAYIMQNPDSRYYIAAKKIPYQTKTAYETERAQHRLLVEELIDQINEENAKKKGEKDEQKIAAWRAQLEAARKVVAEDEKVKGITFEASYIRSYPNKTLACDVIGFADGSNNGAFGLEEYYNDTLNGTPGREYGFLDDMSNLERTTIEATDGQNLVLTIDANIQSIIEKYLKKFNDEHQNAVRQGYGANNIGCIVMEVNTGEILGMASYPNYDLNNPYDLSVLVGMPELDESRGDQPSGNYLTQDFVNSLKGEDEETTTRRSKYLYALWKNFCIQDYYEPGSTAKPFTTAAGLESGALTGNETYNCEGRLDVGASEPVKCHNVYGDGILTLGEAIERSCNVALMYEAMAMGAETFCEYQSTFNFGLKTGIDLAGEAYTANAVYRADKMVLSDLATNSFGQNFDVTMIQMITGFCSLINGGNYYEPHVVSKITSASGATVENIRPRMLKKTISESTSEKIREYTLQVVTGPNGTGHTARPAGYLIGGKTGTAETLPRKNGQYVVSFMGYAPADNPQIAIYVVVDRPNAIPQDDAKYATGIVRNVLTEVLPYLNIPMTEQLSEKETAELQALLDSNTIALGASYLAQEVARGGGSGTDSVNGGAGTGALFDDANGDGVPDGANLDTNGDGTPDAVDLDGDGTADSRPEEEPWKSYAVDPATGYYIDPSDNHLIDPVTGYKYDAVASQQTLNQIQESSQEAGTGTGE